MRKKIDPDKQKIKDQQLRIETLEFLLCGGKHDWAEVDSIISYNEHGEMFTDTVKMCKRCHKRIVI